MGWISEMEMHQMEPAELIDCLAFLCVSTLMSDDEVVDSHESNREVGYV